MYDLINLIINDRQKGLCIMIHHVLVSIDVYKLFFFLLKYGIVKFHTFCTCRRMVNN